MQTAQPLILRSDVDAFTASAFDWLGWLMGLVLTLGAPRRSRRLIRWIEAFERFVEHIIFLNAVRRLAPPPRRTRLPQSVAAGFRRRAAQRRLFFKHARIADRSLSLYDRVLRLIAALAAPERHIARFIARLRKGLRSSTLTIIAAPAHVCASRATPAITHVDSS